MWFSGAWTLAQKKRQGEIRLCLLAKPVGVDANSDPANDLYFITLLGSKKNLEFYGSHLSGS